MSKLALFRTKSFQLLSILAIVLGMGVAFAIDSDNDGMSDLYENFFKLNATNSTDAAANYDSDTLLNQQEALLWTDPRVTDTDADGLDDDADDSPLSRAVMMWGNPDFTSGDEYTYTGPEWWLGAGRSGGEWLTEGGWQVESNAPGTLYIDIDRTTITSNLMLNLLHENAANSQVYLDLADTNDTMVAVHLYGDLTTDDGSQVLSRYVLPLADYPTASRIIIEAAAGSVPYTIWASTLYEDSDADGLDADQEIQFGTSDTNSDTDTDELSDYTETMVEGTDPLDPDTDQDGFSDGMELNELGTSPTVPMEQEGGMAGILQVERWSGIEGGSTTDLKAAGHFGGVPETVSLVTSAEYAPEGHDAGDNYGIRMRGTITAPADGSYTFELTGDADAEVWLSDTASPYGRRLLLALSGWTGFRDLGVASVPSATVELTANQTCYVEILLKEDIYFEHVSLWWTRPGETEPEVIGSEYIQSYVQPADDQDADGLPDAQELAYGLDPSNGVGGGYNDTDGDGFSDHEEINLMGTSPIVSMWEVGVPGVLQVERWNGIRGHSTAALKAAGHFGGVAEVAMLVTSTEYAPPGLNVGEDYGIRMRGTITAPADGTYTFQLTGDADAEVWLSDSESPYGRRRILDLVDIKGWTGFRELEHNLVPSAAVELAANQPCYVEILLKEDIDYEHVTLWWTRPGATEPEVIGSEYLQSYVQPADDQDADGLPDAWELAHGLDPSNGIGGGYKDTDGDGYSDFEEYTFGLNPQAADSDADGLSGAEEVFITRTDPESADTDADGVPDLRTVLSVPGADFVDYHDSHISSTWSIEGTDAVVSKAFADSWVVYNLTVTNAGMYRIAVDATYSCWYELLLAVEIDGIQIDELSMKDSPDLPAFSFFTPWLSEGEHTLKLRTRSYVWEASPFRIHSIELGAVDGIDADGNGLQDWMEAALSEGLDTDGDGISDTDEITIHHTSPTYADSDGDGLADGDELIAGTDPLDADSDDDGVVDGVEVYETLTNPLMAEFDGTAETVLTVAGSQNNNAAGEWEAAGSEILCQGRRGFVEYTLDFPEQDLYCLKINAAHLLDQHSCSPAEPVEESGFLVYVDGLFVGEYPFMSADGVYEDVRAFLPVLPAGEHTVRIFWDNVRSRLSLKISDLKLQALGGPDNNDNGTKDWVEASLEAMAGVDTVTESYISPACIEGDARYVTMMSILGGEEASLPAVKQGAGARWYANIPLEQEGITEATASFQNGALEVPVNVEWVPLNLMDYDGETIYIRRGDMVKFVALPEEAAGGQFEIEYVLGMDGETVRSPNTEPLIYLFPSAGSYTVTGQYTHGNDTVTASITVVAIDGSFPEESPACLVGKTREWTLEGMPSGVVYEADSTVDLSVAPQTANSTLQTISLKASEANGEHFLVARTSPSGAILDSAKLSPFWIQNAADGYVWVVESFEDSELWEVESVQQNMPPEVDLRIKIIIGGVTFNDYTIERWITNVDYDGTGTYRFRLFHPNDSEASTCHTFMAYQDGQFIGEVLIGER